MMGTSNMFGAKTGVATHINEIESHAYLTHYHGHALQLVVSETIKAIKIIRGTLDNWAVFQELGDDILEEKVDSKIRRQVICVQTQKQSFNFFLWMQLGVVSMHADNLSSSLQYTHVML